MLLVGWEWLCIPDTDNGPLMAAIFSVKKTPSSSLEIDVGQWRKESVLKWLLKVDSNCPHVCGGTDFVMITVVMWKQNIIEEYGTHAGQWGLWTACTLLWCSQRAGY